MRRRLTILAAVAAVMAIGVAVPLSIGSSHREAPQTSIDPTADDTDVYAFTADDAQDALTIVGNWIPFEDPAGGPNFYRFDDNADYYLNVDNNGDGRHDVRYLFKFKTRIVNPESFLYAVPEVKSITDPNLNIQQTYSVQRETYGFARDARASKRGHKKAQKHAKGKHRKGKRHHAKRRFRLRSTRTILRNIPVAPNNVGPKTIPDYEKVAREAITELPNGGKVFAGQRDDPFFVDLGMTFDAINFRPGVVPGDHGGGKDDLDGYGVHSIVLQVPEKSVTRDHRSVSGPKDDDAVVGVWASTERKRFSVLASGDDDNHSGGGDVQVSRLGNPLVNEVIIPLGKKDKFNREIPADDAQFGKYVVNPELARVMNALFPGVVKAPETGRVDIVEAVLLGLEGLNRQGNKPVDTIKVNLGTPPTDDPKRLGALAGDLAGYPNGRRLTDDVVDIDLRVVAGALADPEKVSGCKVPPAVCPNPIPLGDGVDQNDKPFSDHFPYLAAPDSGFDSTIKGFPPTAP